MASPTSISSDEPDGLQAKRGDHVLHDLVQSDKPILQFRASLLVPFK